VTEMEGMFDGEFRSSSFNQDLSGWCVSNLNYTAANFARGCLLTDANKPIWGTCPD
jgi:hypothetical protein